MFHIGMCLAALLSCAVRAEDAALAANQPAPIAGAKPPQSAAFITAAHEENLALIRAGKLAEQHAQKATTFRFAVRLIIDHQKIEIQLSRIAASENMPLKPELDVARLAVLSRLESYADPSFDRAFLDAMLLELQQAITLYQGAESSEQDPTSKNYISNTLAILREHLALAQDTLKHLPEQQGFVAPPSLGR
jgi:putative membrane protein